MKMKTIFYLVFGLLLGVGVGFAQGQTKTVTGVVTDTQGVPLPGVNITVEGTTQGTTTDFDGQYSIDVAEGQTLHYNFVGFQEQTVKVGSDDAYNVILQQGTTLDDVVVVGYSTTTQKAFTGTAVNIDGEELAKKNTSTVTEALMGEVSSVRIIQGTGQPGSAPTIRIRGFGSVNGNRSPLIVLDGVPFSGALTAINPEDIKNLVVLKDATATAIYGSRGSNGVILIETKKGKRNHSEIKVDYKVGTNYRGLPRYNTIRSPEQFIGLTWESLYNRAAMDGQGNDPEAFANAALFSSQGIDPWYNMWNVADGGELIDPATREVRPGVTRRYTPKRWDKTAFNPQARNEANVNFSGGDENTTYYASVGYLRDKGYSINSDFTRYSTRLNLDQKITDWLRGSMNLGYNISKSNQNGQSSDSGSIFWFADEIPPIYPVFIRDENGDRIPDPIYGGYLYDYAMQHTRGFGIGTNSIGDATHNINRSENHEVNFNNKFTADLYEGLTAESTFGVMYHQSRGQFLGNPFYGSSAPQDGSVSSSSRTTFNWDWTQLIRYKNKFGLHNIEAFVAHETTDWRQDYLSASRSNLVIPWIPQISNAVVRQGSTGYRTSWSLESFFAQINYNYDNRYFVSASGRRDGSSRFARANRWDNFGSVGLSWIMTNESFMDNVDWLPYLKVKTSYGVAGDQSGVGLYPYADTFSSSNSNDEISLAFDSKGNPDLTWERKNQFQVGLDFGLFENSRIEGSLAYYNNRTNNLIFTRRVPPSLGYATITVNDGALEDSGFEFDLTGHILQGQDFFLDVNLNGATMHNRIKRMPIDPATGEQTVLQPGTFALSTGHSMEDYYIREYAGVDPDDGLPMFNRYFDKATGETITSMTDYMHDHPDAEVDMETTKNYQDATRQYIGKTGIPDLQGGFGLNAGYKGITLSVQFRYMIGGYGFDSQYADLMGNPTAGNNNWHKDILRRWQKPGDVTDVPILNAGLGDDSNWNGTSDRFLVSKTALNLNNIRLAYSLPTQWIQHLGMTRANINVTGTNIALWSKRKGFNPFMYESGGSDRYMYNPLSAVTGGITVTF